MTLAHKVRLEKVQVPAFAAPAAQYTSRYVCAPAVERVLARDMGCCYLCDTLGADQVDHLVEVADGGTNALTNLASCHAACHDRRHRDPEWAQDRVEKALAVLGEGQA